MYWIFGITIYLLIGLVIISKFPYSIPLWTRILFTLVWFPIITWNLIRDMLSRIW